VVKVLIDGLPLLSPLAGVGVYTHQLSNYFLKFDTSFDYTFFYGFFSKNLFVHKKGWFFTLSTFKFYLNKIPFISRRMRMLKDLLVSTYKKPFDLYFEPNFIIFPKIKAKKIIATVHDFSFYKYPKWHPRERIEYFKKNFWPNIKRADLVITPSQFIRNEALDFLPITAERIKVIHNGYDTDVFKLYSPEILSQVKTKLSLPTHFLLFFGALEPRKNLVRVIKAYLDLPKEIKKEVKLVIAGAPGWSNKEIKLLIKKHKDIYNLGYIGTQILAYLYNLATVFVYPSLYEGFGIPPLEAMACGCPVIASQKSSLEEVCGEAAFYVDPYNISSIGTAILKVLNDISLQTSLRERGLNRIRHFSWKRTALEHLNTFHGVLEDK
jgi:glycosyltransferase involved in cell wall biosynthesis